ncbi:MAG: hypothetical protein JO107_08420 [Hyphomicrobiales bacterium]|nr:hypothetical protein [Hyphomicrobiales bacterium]
MNKHRRLVEAITELERILGAGFAITNRWEADLLATGISNSTKPGFVAYIALREPDGFDVAIDGPPRSGSELPYEDHGWFRCANIGEVASILRNFLAFHLPESEL